jgi:hypothetical protein
MTNTNTAFKDSTIVEKPIDDSRQIKLIDLKNAIPEDLFQSSLAKSLFYFFLDASIILTLFASAIYLNSWVFYPFYFFLQGTFFWALFLMVLLVLYISFPLINYLSLHFMILLRILNFPHSVLMMEALFQLFGI